MNVMVKATLVALATIAGALTAVAQFLDYFTSGKAHILAAALAITLSSVPVVVIVTIWRRESSTDSSFSWDLFRTTAAACAIVGIAGIAIVAVSASQPALSPNSDSIVTPKPTASRSEVAPTSSPPSEVPQNSEPTAAPVRLEFLQPNDQQGPVAPKSDVEVKVRVNGLPPDRTVWVLSKPENSDYFIIEGRPIAEADGEFSGTAYEIGDYDDRGKTIAFYFVLASNECATELAKLSKTIPRRVVVIPGSCMRLPNPTVRVQIR
jgi:hypothetical protein